MMMSEIIAKVKSLAENDQSIANTDITGWVDDAIDRINIALKCNIPKSGGNTTTLVPSFDTRFHESLVLFSVSKYRESDSDYQSGQYFRGQFDDMVHVMQRDMVLNPSIRVDPNVQQIVVASTSTYIYPLTMLSGSYFDNIDVYQNDVLLSTGDYTIDSNTQQITIAATITLTVGDKITVVFENNSDLNNPPYLWWGQTGW